MAPAKTAQVCGLPVNQIITAGLAEEFNLPRGARTEKLRCLWAKQGRDIGKAATQMENPVHLETREVDAHEIKRGSRKLLAGAAGYAALLAIFLLVARFFHLEALREYPVSTFLGFATLFAHTGFSALAWRRYCSARCAARQGESRRRRCWRCRTLF